jgi:hypothetical protein
MNKSESIGNLAKALCKAQNEMGGAVKDAKNPFFKSNYADLTAVIKAIKEPFANNGLSYSQFPVTSEGWWSRCCDCVNALVRRMVRVRVLLALS